MEKKDSKSRALVNIRKKEIVNKEVHLSKKKSRKGGSRQQEKK